jgi:hypothetical protein
VDLESGQVNALFHPRNDRWEDHFQWDGAILVGKTPAGRATVDVLRVNLAARIENRRLLIVLGDLIPD